MPLTEFAYLEVFHDALSGFGIRIDFYDAINLLHYYFKRDYVFSIDTWYRLQTTLGKTVSEKLVEEVDM